jgi:hypothetical protein
MTTWVAPGMKSRAQHRPTRRLAVTAQLNNQLAGEKIVAKGRAPVRRIFARTNLHFFDTILWTRVPPKYPHSMLRLRLLQPWGADMNKSLAAIAFVILLLPVSAHAQERVGDAALGALSGLVLGPVGVVAGAVVGFTAGPSIANAWGLRRSQRVRRARAAQYPARATPVASEQGTPMPPASAGSRSSATSQAATALVAPQPQAAPPPAMRAAESASPGPVPVQGFE